MSSVATEMGLLETRRGQGATAQGKNRRQDVNTWAIPGLALLLLAVLAWFNYILWWDQERGWHEVHNLSLQLQEQQSQNQRLSERNTTLRTEIDALKGDFQAIEEQARENLGMIHQGETFFHVLPKDADKNQ